MLRHIMTSFKLHKNAFRQLTTSHKLLVVLNFSIGYQHEPSKQTTQQCGRVMYMYHKMYHIVVQCGTLLCTTKLWYIVVLYGISQYILWYITTFCGTFCGTTQCFVVHFVMKCGTVWYISCYGVVQCGTFLIYVRFSQHALPNKVIPLPNMVMTSSRLMCIC